MIITDGQSGWGEVLRLRNLAMIERTSAAPRILRLALRAPDIVDKILAGTTDQGMPLPADWAEQRQPIRHFEAWQFFGIFLP